MKKFLIAICFIIILLAAVLIKSAVKPGSSDEEQIMLIDFCKSTVATVDGDGYSETVLYQNKDGSLEVHYFSKYDGDEKESHISYPADENAADEAYKIINKNHMDKWNSKYHSAGLEGAEYSLTFRTDKGEYMRVSSENMPDNGIAIMNEIRACMDNSAER